MNKLTLAYLSMMVTALFVTGQAAVGQPCNNGPYLVEDGNPQLWSCNPKCCDINDMYAGIKLDPPESGTYPLTGPFYCNTEPPFEGNPGFLVQVDVYMTDEGEAFDWSSNFAVRMMIVKGGPHSYVYLYPDGAYGGTGLHAPTVPSGYWADLSHIDWCFDPLNLAPNVDFVKTADGTFDQTVTWDVEKSAFPAVWDVFAGDQATSDWNIAVMQSFSEGSNYAVSGTVSLVNSSATLPITVWGIADMIYGCGVDPIVVDLTTCFPVGFFPYEIPPAGSIECAYAVALPGLCDPGAYNEAMAWFDEGMTVSVDTAVEILFTPNIIGPPEVLVEDLGSGQQWTAVSDTVFTVPEVFSCPADTGNYGEDFYFESVYVNEAAISFEGDTLDSDTASVMVTCWVLGVDKDAMAGFDRTWTWTIDKQCPPYPEGLDHFTVALDQPFPVDYDVILDAVSADTGWYVEGGIMIVNPAPVGATINSITDTVSDGMAVACDCGGIIFPYVLAAGDTLDCTYTAALPDNAPRTNTATAALENYSFYYAGGVLNADPLSPPYTVFTAVAAVEFGDPTNETDECAFVSDDHYGVLDTVCATVLPDTLTYQLDIGLYTENGDTICDSLYAYDNIASFVTNDLGMMGVDSCTVLRLFPCTAVSPGIIGIYPNPTAGSFIFTVRMPARRHVELAIYSTDGCKMATVYSGTMAAGLHTLAYTAPPAMHSGIYICTLETANGRSVTRLNLVR